MKHLLFLLILFTGLSYSNAQQQISGVVNSYAEVIAMDSVNRSVEVSDATSFAEGDLVMLIQMQGAQIDESLTNDFGKIDSIKGAGKWELHRICSVDGQIVSLMNHPSASFEAGEGLQLIEIPEYPEGAELNSELTGKRWDGNTGGVVALKVVGTLNLKTFNINMSGRGFRGGIAALSGGGCLFVNDPRQYSDINSTNDRAQKGEGIAKFIRGKECSRGPQANGGGGGNNHNGGGGGGSNFS